MKTKISLSTMLTLIALVGCLSMAAAQSTPPTPIVEMTRELHNALTQDGTVSEGSGIDATQRRTGQTVTTQVIGWNNVHATTCLSYWDGTNYWLYVYPSEGGYWYTSTPSHQYAIAPACQTGNWLSFYVYNSTGNWDRVQMFPYR
jgi:hypothetical protein